MSQVNTDTSSESGEAPISEKVVGDGENTERSDNKIRITVKNVVWLIKFEQDSYEPRKLVKSLHRDNIEFDLIIYDYTDYVCLNINAKERSNDPYGKQIQSFHIQISAMSLKCKEEDILLKKTSVTVPRFEPFEWKDTIYIYCLQHGTLPIQFEASFYFADYTLESSRVLDRRTKQFDEFERMLKDDKYSDVTIEVEGEQFHVHKVILASRSSVFAAMLEHNMKENVENIIKIENISTEIMSEVLRYIYAAKVNDIEELAYDLFVAADRYNLEGLKETCEDALIAEMNINNVCKILKFINRYECPTLRSEAIEFVKKHAEELNNMVEFASTITSVSHYLQTALNFIAV